MPSSFDADHARRFVGPDLDPNCLQRQSADDTSKQNRELMRNSELGIYIKLKEHQIFACESYFAGKLCQQPKASSG